MKWFLLVCLPVCTFFTLGAVLVITGLIAFAVSHYLEEYSDSDRSVIEGGKAASYALLISGAVFLVVLVCIMICSKIKRPPKRRVCRTSEQWRDTMLRLIEDANTISSLPRPPIIPIPPPPMPPSLSQFSSGPVTPPPCYESSYLETSPPSYDVAVSQLAQVHLTYTNENASKDNTSLQSVQNDR